MKLHKQPRNTSVKRQASPKLQPRAGQYLVSNLRTIERQQPRIVTTLSPYLGEIERKRKARSVATQHPARGRDLKKIYKEASSKRFRIQECSYYTGKGSSDGIKSLTMKSEKESSKSIRQFGQLNLAKYQKDVASYTQKPGRNGAESPSRPAFYSELYDKLKAKNSKRDGKFRRGKYVESSLDERSEIIHPGPNNPVIHFGFTTSNTQGLASGGTTVSNQKHQRHNFRRNKFDVQSQAVSNSLQIQETQVPKYSSAEIQKKESNSSLIRELENQTHKDIQIQERNTKIKMNRLLQKSLEKSTQEYFKDGYNHRKPKSRNDIQIYISTVSHPLKNRNSQASTLHASDNKNLIEAYVSELTSTKNRSLNYDFEMEMEVFNDQVVLQQSNSNTDECGQESIEIGDTEFQRQRKAAEKAKFEQQDVVGISWSGQQMQFNKLNTCSN